MLTGTQALATYKAAWEGVRSYTCIVRAREESGYRVQDRTYRFWFEKPHATRMEIVGGQGRGEVAIWHGGKTLQVRGSGLVSFIRLQMPIDDPRATSVRGATIAQVNFGAFYDHLVHLKTKSVIARAGKGAMTIVTEVVADPAADGGVTREVIALGANGLPVRYSVYAGARQVKDVTFADLRVNVPIPPGTFGL